MKIFIKEKLKKYDSQNQMNKYRFAAHKILQNISEQILILLDFLHEIRTFPYTQK